MYLFGPDRHIPLRTGPGRHVPLWTRMSAICDYRIRAAVHRRQQQLPSLSPLTAFGNYPLAPCTALNSHRLCNGTHYRQQLRSTPCTVFDM